MNNLSYITALPAFKSCLVIILVSLRIKCANKQDQ